MHLTSSNLPLSFSLRALLVLVTMLCVWLAWERHVVVTRREIRAAWGGDRRVYAETAADFAHVEARKARQRSSRGLSTVSVANRLHCVNACVPWLRAMMRDEAVQTVAFCGADDATVALAIQWFPEAEFSADGIRMNRP
jgi:hypothetical protein